MKLPALQSLKIAGGRAILKVMSALAVPALTSLELDFFYESPDYERSTAGFACISPVTALRRLAIRNLTAHLDALDLRPLRSLTSLHLVDTWVQSLLVVLQRTPLLRELAVQARRFAIDDALLEALSPMPAPALSPYLRIVCLREEDMLENTSSRLVDMGRLQHVLVERGCCFKHVKD